jgi:hypothetical protein
MKIAISSVLILILSGCSSLFPKAERVAPEVKIVTEQVAVEIYQPPLPQEIQLEDVRWFILTEANLEEKWDEIKRFQGGEVVVFGMTPMAYENMAYNLQEIRRYIRQQKEIILYYRAATQLNDDVNGDGKVDSEDWKIKNQEALEDIQD